jgi:nitrogen fixation protein FixH
MTAATRWTIAIVGILSAAVASAVTLAVVSQMGGKSKVIPHYYERATHYDTNIDEATAAKKLGWHTTVKLAGGTLSACMTDAAGAPVVADVEVVGQHRAAPEQDITKALAPEGGGCYQVAFADKTGWYDVVVRAKRGDEKFMTSAAVVQQ